MVKFFRKLTFLRKVGSNLENNIYYKLEQKLAELRHIVSTALIGFIVRGKGCASAAS